MDLPFGKTFIALWPLRSLFVEDIANGRTVSGLLLQGYVGRGKTYLAASIANALVERDVDVRFIVVPDFLDELRATFDTSSMGSESELMNLIKTAPVLILDDLGAHNYTDWSIKTLFCHFELSYQLRASHHRNNKFVSGIHGRTVGNASLPGWWRLAAFSK